jgi:hypothetical protein
MRKYRIRSALGLPMVSAVVVGDRGASRVELVFDSGAANTQIHIGTLRAVGISFDKRTPDLSKKGVTGAQNGFSCALPKLHLFGRKYEQLMIAAFDFSDWADDGIDGLLGWDLIEQLHLEMDGPRGDLKIF